LRETATEDNSMPANPTPKRRPPTPQEIIEQQRVDAAAASARLKQQAADTARAAQQRKAAPAQVPAVKPAAAPPAPAVIDTRSPQERYLDEVAPSFIVGRLIKFSKEGQFITADDGQAISEDVDFYALCGEVQIGWIKFSQDEGVPPTRHMGLLYDGFVMPARESLGDSDPAEWPAGLDGQPADVWLHQQNLVLQQCDTKELFTYSTQSKTGRRAVGNLLRHYNRMRRSAPDDVPIVRLRPGGFQHKDDRIGWVPTPMFCVVGRAPRDEGGQAGTATARHLGRWRHERFDSVLRGRQKHERQP
jgi:hypothetical protein